MDNIDILSLITIAFLASIGHCIGMCGGIVIAYSSSKVGDKESKTKASLSHLAYNFGRVTTYIFLGAIFGAIGGVVSFNNIAIATLTIVAGLFMILTGISLLGKLNFLTKLEHSFFKSKWYQNSFRGAIESKSLFSFYFLGLLNGLLPCGLVYFYAVTAASTGSALWGGVVMFIFGLSTVPALFTLGLFTSLLSKSNIRKVMMNLSSIIVIFYGLYTIYRGYDYINNPTKSLLNCCDTQEVKKSNDPKVEPFKIGK
jgi:sulfite exporter TauE/SafE